MTYAEQLKLARKEGEVRDLAPKFLEFRTVGDEVVGKLIDISTVEGQHGTYKQYLLDTDEGVVKLQLGAATDADVAPQMALGALFWLTFEGVEKLSGGRTINKIAVRELVLPAGGREQPSEPSSAPKTVGEGGNG